MSHTLSSFTDEPANSNNKTHKTPSVRGKTYILAHFKTTDICFVCLFAIKSD